MMGRVLVLGFISIAVLVAFMLLVVWLVTRGSRAQRQVQHPSVSVVKTTGTDGSEST